MITALLRTNSFLFLQPKQVPISISISFVYFALLREVVAVTIRTFVYSHTPVDVTTYSANQRLSFVLAVYLLAVAELHRVTCEAFVALVDKRPLLAGG